MALTNPECQEGFASLDIAEMAQTDDWIHTLIDHEAFSGILPTKYEPLRLDKKSIKSSNRGEEEFNAILDSWHAYIGSQIERSRNGKPAACDPASTTYSEEVFEPLKRINTSGPPKRFRQLDSM
jgi:hypothetical protein